MAILRILPLSLVVLATVLAAPLIGLFARPGAAGAPVIVIASPFRDAASLIAEAGGDALPPIAGLALAASASPGFSERLRRLGALAVLDAGRLGALCAVPGSGPARPDGR